MPRQLIASRQAERRAALESIQGSVTYRQFLDTSKKLERELPVTLHSVRYHIQKMKAEHFRLSLRREDNKGMLALLRAKIEREQQLEFFLVQERGTRRVNRRTLDVVLNS